MRRTFIGCAIVAVLLIRCSQQAEADLAVCKSDLTKARDELTAAKTARPEAEQNASALQQQVPSTNAQIAQLHNAAQEAASKNADPPSNPSPRQPSPPT